MKALMTGLVFLTATAVSAQSNPPKHMPADVAVFAVLHENNSLLIDPVVIVHYGPDQRFRTVPSLNSPLPSRDWAEADLRKIEEAFYGPGSLVSVFSGGEKLGAATLRKSHVDGSACVDLTAMITYEGAGKPLLAANVTSEITSHPSTRRAASPAESSLLRSLTIRWLSDYGLDRKLLQRGSMSPVISTALRKSAGRALVGRFDVASKHAIHRLFVIAEQDGGRYRLTLTALDIQNDIEDGTDKTAREYLDQLDVDNDGLDDVITSASHYESWSYTVWKFDATHKAWRNAYTGGGGGC